LRKVTSTNSLGNILKAGRRLVRGIVDSPAAALLE